MLKAKVVGYEKSNRGYNFFVKCLKCGKIRKIWHSQIKTGRGAFCSLECSKEHRAKLLTGKKRTEEQKKKFSESRLKMKERLGYINSPETRIKLSKTWFKKGITAFNKGLKSGNSYLNQEKCWPAHNWIKKLMGSARNYNCEICETKQARHWSNKNHKYEKEIKDWQALCVKCHSFYDKIHNNKFNYKNYEGNF